MKFNNIKSSSSQKGITLFLAVAIMAIFLATGLALNIMLITQLKMKEGVSNSLTAFLAADTGLEYELFDYSIASSTPPYEKNGALDTGSTYKINVKEEGDNTQDPKCENDNDPSTSYSCIFSTGKFSQSQRRVSMRR